MKNTILVRAVQKVPAFAERAQLFESKLQLEQYAAGSIKDYCHKVAAFVSYLGKLPEECVQADIDYYLGVLLNRRPQPGISYFKHTVFGLKAYYRFLGHPEPGGLVIPKVRKSKKLPRVLSEESVKQLLRCSDVYAKALLGTIYDLGLRAGEARDLKWTDIDMNRGMVLIHGKGRKDRYVPISKQMIKVLRYYRKRYPSRDYVFKSYGSGNKIKDDYVRKVFRTSLAAAGLDTSLTTHALRHSYACHLLEHGESIMRVKERMGHKHLSTTEIYLHVVKIEPKGSVLLVDDMFPPK